MKKILFLHGFFSSGNCLLAKILRQELAGHALLLSPDLPLQPFPALEKILAICKEEQPSLIVGNSCGSFYGQIASRLTGIPALVGNPHFAMDQFLRERLGKQQYKTPRTDGQQNFVITEDLANAFAKIQNIQFDSISTQQKERVWGLFGTNDTLAHFQPTFQEHYTHSFSFPGSHTPNEEEIRHWYAPLALQMLRYDF